LVGNGNNKPFKAKIGVRSTHSIKFLETTVEIYQYSGISKPEIISQVVLMKHVLQNISMPRLLMFQSPKKCTIIPVLQATVAGGTTLLPTSESLKNNPKAKVYADSLAAAGIVPESVNICENIVVPCENFYDYCKGWAQYPGNSKEKMSKEVVKYLQQLYNIGVKCKARKVLPEQALQDVVRHIIGEDWAQQLVVTVPKIRAFYSLTPARQAALLRSIQTAADKSNAQVGVEITNSVQLGGPDISAVILENDNLEELFNNMVIEEEMMEVIDQRELETLSLLDLDKLDDELPDSTYNH